MRYTGNSYGGQLVSIGRVVIVNMGTAMGIQAGLIQRIDDAGGPVIALWDPNLSNGVASTACEFKQTKTVEDIEALPPNVWTWPVRA